MLWACVLEAEDVAVEFVECVWDEVWQVAGEEACLFEGVPAGGDGVVCCVVCGGCDVCNHCCFSFRVWVCALLCTVCTLRDVVWWCATLGRGVWGLGESGVWLLWEVEEFLFFVFAGAGFLGGFVGVALVAEDAEVVGVVGAALAYWGDVVYFVSWLAALLAGVVVAVADLLA